MKAKLIFDLDNQEDVHKYLQCNKAQDLTFCINDILQLLRTERKYKDSDTVKIDDITDIIFNKYNINIDQLYE
jgi:hypothetical protein